MTKICTYTYLFEICKVQIQKWFYALMLRDEFFLGKMSGFILNNIRKINGLYNLVYK
jgi:hypothetical protein